MKFHVIDRENWNREQYFEHYLELKCTFSMTVNVDITLLIKKVHQKGIKFYPTFIYIISRIINKHKEFRTCFNDEGVLGYWEEMIRVIQSFIKMISLFQVYGRIIQVISAFSIKIMKKI